MSSVARCMATNIAVTYRCSRFQRFDLIFRKERAIKKNHILDRGIEPTLKTSCVSAVRHTTFNKILVQLINHCLLPFKIKLSYFLPYN